MRVLLIGGANGGQKVNILDGERRILFDKPGNINTKEEYFVDTIKVGDDKYHFGLIEGMSLSQGIARLMECYSGG